MSTYDADKRFGSVDTPQGQASQANTLNRYSEQMATEMVFSGGHRVNVAMTNAQTLIQALNRPSLGKPIQTPSGELAPGWIDIQTENEGVILVNPASVAYVRDVDDHQPVMDLPG